MNDIQPIRTELPCANHCARKGTENDDEPALLGARHGRFCDRCYYRIENSLKIAGETVEHIVSLVGTTAAGTDDRVDSSREAPLPFNTQAFNDANEIYSRLVHWCRHWSDLIHVRAPGPAARAWTRRDSRVAGLPHNITPADARYAVSIMSQWLRIHSNDILELNVPTDDINYYSEDLGDIYRANARWPKEARPYYSKLPCPDDGGRIAVYPPTAEGEDERIKCEKCGRIFSQEMHAFYTNLFATIEAESGNGEASKRIKQSERVRRHLTEKYTA